MSPQTLTIITGAADDTLVVDRYVNASWHTVQSTEVHLNGVQALAWLPSKNDCTFASGGGEGLIKVHRFTDTLETLF